VLLPPCYYPGWQPGSQPLAWGCELRYLRCAVLVCESSSAVKGLSYTLPADWSIQVSTVLGLS
jgi:hypothetical protein